MKGIIYILTNPSFPEYVKIGYADDLERRLSELNRSECTPYAFRCYATYAVDERLTDLKLHQVIDTLNPDLRSIDTVDGKKRVREFYMISAEEAYNIFEAIAEISGTKDRLTKVALTEKDEQEETAATATRRSRFTFSMLDITVGSELVYVDDPNIKCIVANDRQVEYQGQLYTLSALDYLFSGQCRQGPRYFTYNDEILTDRRLRLE